MPNSTFITFALVVSALWVRWYFYPLRREAPIWGLLADRVRFRWTWLLHWAIVEVTTWVIAILVVNLVYTLLG